MRCLRTAVHSGRPRGAAGCSSVPSVCCSSAGRSQPGASSSAPGSGAHATA